MSGPSTIVVLRPTDLDPSHFSIDPTTNMISIVNASDDADTYTASAVISGDKATMFQSDGTLILADPTQPGYVYAGIALNAAAQGAAVQVQDSGCLTVSYWTWIAGLPIFTAPGGNLSQTPPDTGCSHIIGWAISSTTIRLKSEDQINLGT